MKLKKRTKVLLMVLGSVLLLLLLYLGTKIYEMRDYIHIFIQEGRLAELLVSESIIDGAAFLSLLRRVVVGLTFFVFLPGLGWLIYALCTRRRTGRKKTILRLSGILLILTATVVAFYWPKSLPGIKDPTWEIHSAEMEMLGDNVTPTREESEQVRQLLADYQYYRVLENGGGFQWSEQTARVSFTTDTGSIRGDIVVSGRRHNFATCWGPWHVERTYRVLDPDNTLTARLREILQ